MRLVQQRLDALSLQSNLIESYGNKGSEECTLNGVPGLSSHEKIELFNKLEELEAKKEKMDAMIQRVKQAHQNKRDTYSIPENSMGQINEESRLVHCRLAEANANSNLANIPSDNYLPLPKPNISNEGIWNRFPTNNPPLPNGDQRFSVSSPTLSLLENLRALEVSRESSDETEYRISQQNEGTEKSKSLAFSSATLKQRKQDTESSVRLIGSYLDTSRNNEPQIPHMLSTNIFTSQQEELGQTRPEEQSFQPRNISNASLQCEESRIKGRLSQFEQMCTKENNLHRSNGIPIEISRVDSKKIVQASKQSSSIGAITHDNVYQDTVPRNAITVREQIKELQNQIEFLYDEISIASMAAECSMARESLGYEKLTANQAPQFQLDANLQTSSNSSYVMLNNTSGQGAEDLVDQKGTPSNNKHYFDNKSNSETLPYWKKLLMALKGQQYKLIEQEKQISHLNKSLGSYVSRLAVVERDMDGLHTVLRSLISIIDKQAQQSTLDLHERSNFIAASNPRVSEQQIGDTCASNRMHNIVGSHRNQAQSTYPAMPSTASNMAQKIHSNKTPRNLGKNSRMISGLVDRNVSKNDVGYSSELMKGRPMTANITNFGTNGKGDSDKISSRPLLASLNRSFNSLQSTNTTSNTIISPEMAPVSNSINLNRDDRPNENFQQLFDNEPWRNFEIDMSNGLGNLSFGSFTLANDTPQSIPEHNLLGLGQDLESSNNVGLSGFPASSYNINENDLNSASSMQNTLPFLSTLENSVPQPSITRRDLLEGFQTISEPPYGSKNDLVGAGQSNRHDLRNIEEYKEAWKLNNDSLPRRQRNIMAQKHSIKPMIPASKPIVSETVASTLINPVQLPIQSAATTSALNNQVPPGRRANNYWDNFKSYSRQNRLEVTPCMPQNTSNLPSRPTAAVGAVATNLGQRAGSTVASSTPMIAQVPPRQQSLLNNNEFQPISSPELSFPIDGRENINHNFSSLDQSVINSAINYNAATRNGEQPNSLQITHNIASMYNGEAGRQSIPTTRIQTFSHNSAFVEPYLSNAHSPCRPRRKQKINREQNREMSSNNVLEGDNNIVQAAAMARAVANNSAAINQTHSVPTQNDNKNSVNQYPRVFNSNSSRAINDLHFHSDNENLSLGQYVSYNLGTVVPTTNTSAMVLPMPHQSHSSTIVQQNVNINQHRQSAEPFISHPRDQAVTESSDVSRITQSIFGHINNLISQAEASPERLQRLFEGIQTASTPGFDLNADNMQHNHLTNGILQEEANYRGPREVSTPGDVQILDNFGDISADDEDENIASLNSRCQNVELEKDSNPQHSMASSNQITSASEHRTNAFDKKNLSMRNLQSQRELIPSDKHGMNKVVINKSNAASLDEQVENLEQNNGGSSENSDEKTMQSQENDSVGNTGEILVYLS